MVLGSCGGRQGCLRSQANSQHKLELSICQHKVQQHLAPPAVATLAGKQKFTKVMSVPHLNERSSPSTAGSSTLMPPQQAE